jgi:outer membrane protein assembly factor BamB
MKYSSPPFRSSLIVVCLALAGSLPLAVVSGGAGLCGTVADDIVAARAGLNREWVVQAPFDSSRWRLERVAVGQALVVAEAGDGTLTAIATGVGEAPAGTVVWTRPGDGSRFPLETPGIGPTSVTVARGNNLTAIDAATGRTIQDRRLPSLASAAAVPSAGFLYVPLAQGDIARFAERPATITIAEAVVEAEAMERRPDQFQSQPAEDRLELLKSPGTVDLAPIPYQNGVLWCTTDGVLVAVVIEDDSNPRFEFDLENPISGPPVVRGSDIFVATRAGDIARIARSPSGFRATTGVGRTPDGETVAYTGWHTVIDEVPEGGPIVGEATVVVSLGPAGLAAFHAETGDLLWQSPLAGTPLAIINGRVWCLDETGFLSGRDLGTGRRVARLCLGGFTVPVVDPRGERLVLASPDGLIVSLAGRRTVAAEPPVPQPPSQPLPPAPAGEAHRAAEEDPEPEADEGQAESVRPAAGL